MLEKNHEPQIIRRDINFLALEKGEERYIFKYADEYKAEILRILGRYASNPELSFTWYEAAVLSQKVRQEPPRPPIQKTAAILQSADDLSHAQEDEREAFFARQEQERVNFKLRQEQQYNEMLQKQQREREELEQAKKHPECIQVSTPPGPAFFPWTMFQPKF